MTARSLALIGLLASSVTVGATDPSTMVVGDAVERTVEKGETLRSISARHGVDVATLTSDNRLRPGAPLKAGKILLVDSRHVVPGGIEDGSVVVNVPQRMLFHRSGDRVIAFPVAVGSRTWPTPIRSFTILEKETDPTWDVPESILAESRAKGKVLPAKVPPGPSNPLGRHWLGLSGGSVGIHGTNAPASIYRAATHGCIRAHPDDIAGLFERVGVGTTGRFIYEPVLLAGDGNDVFLEVHPDVYQRAAGTALEHARLLAEAAGVTDRVDWERAAAVVSARQGVARIVTRRPPSP